LDDAMANIFVSSDVEGELTGVDIALETTSYILSKHGGLDGTTIYQLISWLDDVFYEFPPDNESVKKFINDLDYSSGSTLRLAPGVFLGYGLNNEQLAKVYREVTKLYPGAVEGGIDIQKVLGIPIHYITTTWESGVAGFVEPLGVPPERVHASPLDLDRYRLSEKEREVIRNAALELNDIASTITDKGKELQIDSSIKSFEDFEPFRQERFWKMKEIFVDRLGGIPEIRRLYEEVKIVDAGQKAKIFRNEMEKAGFGYDKSVSVGDSSTDVVMHRRCKENGGIAIAHNAKSVAIDAANFALGTKNYYITVSILGIAERKGKEGLIKAANNWGFSPLIDYMGECGLPEVVIEKTEKIFGPGGTEFPHFEYLEGLTDEQMEIVKDWSSDLRSQLRGTETAIIR
jgi:predicted HAD superfamily phosphohydrolase